MKNKLLSMKAIMILLLLQLSVSKELFAQNIAINSTGNSPDTSAMLDISSTSQGLLMPRMTTAQMNAIVLPATGLMIYNTSLNVFEVNTGTANSPVWTPLVSSKNGWTTTGNSGTNSGNNFIGTTDNVSLRARTNNIQRMVIDSMGNVGVGTSSPNARLEISSGTSGVSGLRFTNMNASSSTGTGQSIGVDASGNIITITPATYGDIKYGIQSADHNGWIKLDGRLKSTLTATQQAQATALGIGANLPDASNSFLVQNGNALGTVSGSNTKTIAQANLPNVNLTGTTNSAGAHSHTYDRPFDCFNCGGLSYPANNNDGAFAVATTSTSGAHTHTVTVALGGSGTPLDITPLSFSANAFIYLGL